MESGARTHDTRNHNPMLCQLSYDHRMRSCFSKAGAKVLLFFDIRKFLSVFLQKNCIYGKIIVTLHAI